MTPVDVMMLATLVVVLALVAFPSFRWAREVQGRAEDRDTYEARIAELKDDLATSRQAHTHRTRCRGRRRVAS